MKTKPTSGILIMAIVVLAIVPLSMGYVEPLTVNQITKTIIEGEKLRIEGTANLVLYTSIKPIFPFLYQKLIPFV